MFTDIQTSGKVHSITMPVIQIECRWKKGNALLGQSQDNIEQIYDEDIYKYYCTVIVIIL